MEFVDRFLLPTESIRLDDAELGGVDAPFGGFLLSSAPPSPRQEMPHRTPVIEIVGTNPGSGKTRMLYRITAEALAGDGTHGAGAVVWIDADGHFDYSCFHGFLAAVLAGRESAADVAVAVEAHLRHLHIFRPQTSHTLLAILHGLEGYLLDESAHSSASRPLRVVMISGLSSFFWQDRREELDAEPEHLPPGVAISHVFIERWRSLVASLKDLQSKFECIIVASNVALTTPEDSSTGPSLRPHLPRVWSNSVTLRLFLTKNKRPKLPPGLSLENALQQERSRKLVSHESCSTAWIEQSQSGTGDNVHPTRKEPMESFRLQIWKDKILVVGDERTDDPRGS